MITQTVKVRGWRGEEIDVTGPVFGALAVTPNLDDRQRFEITHLPTGWAIRVPNWRDGFASLDEAVTALKAIEPLADWSSFGPSNQPTVELGNRCKVAIDAALSSESVTRPAYREMIDTLRWEDIR